jgi:hypothetical protein
MLLGDDGTTLIRAECWLKTRLMAEGHSCVGEESEHSTDDRRDQAQHR